MKMSFNDASAFIEKHGGGRGTDLAGFRRLYKAAALKLHPDRVVKSSERSADLRCDMAMLNSAWEIVTANLAKCDPFDDGSSLIDPLTKDALYTSHLPTHKSLSSLLTEAFSVVNEPLWSNWRLIDTVYHKGLQLRVCSWHGVIRITDLANALSFGKKCTVFTVNYSPLRDDDGFCRFLDFLDELGDRTLATFVAHCRKLEYREDRFGNKLFEDPRGIVFCCSEQPSSRVFSPFRLDKLKPLDVVPERPTRMHLVRLLANGQYRCLKQDYHITDESIGCSEGMIHTPFRMLFKLIESPSSCFMLYKSGDSWSFGDHSNDSKSVIPVLSNRFPELDFLKSDFRIQ